MALGDVSFLEIPVDLPESFPSAYFHISSLRYFYLWVHSVRFFLIIFIVHFFFWEEMFSRTRYQAFASAFSSLYSFS